MNEFFQNLLISFINSFIRFAGLVDGSIVIVNDKCEEPEMVPGAHEGPVRHVVVTGTTLITAGDDKNLKIWTFKKDSV